VLVSADTQTALVRAVLDEQFGLGPLQPYLDDPDVENIDINGPHQVWVTLRDGRRLAGRPVAASDEELVEMVRTWGLREGQTPREFCLTSPLLNAALNGAGGAGVGGDVGHAHRSRLGAMHRLVDITLDDLTAPQYATLSPELANSTQSPAAAPGGLRSRQGLSGSPIRRCRGPRRQATAVFPIRSENSTRRLANPHSLSYQPRTLTWWPTASVSGASKIDE
jgi:hypothetical protein